MSLQRHCKRGDFRLGSWLSAYFPGGTQIEAVGHDEAVRQTKGLLKSNFDDYNCFDVITNGCAAMTAFGRMQFSDISEKEHNAIITSLLRYCELDTLAMLMIYERWRSLKAFQ